ncbi:type II toxin-antitoxin system Phd/YefM family antitoxin [Roseicella aquatilis]|uniref:Antitoxin n=1 Tax=Roseicella aquatilis TaxID=2527868 RepID=A0A4R4DDD1_9PROT|nr:type II toxin-antitoxin system prevent-host-death family antitoxin [Roseicella aquatilis]TCZ58608.1 type II toxin-antitoxin system prevent-host-death family antitoxin [Roseicella aquatilis]
MSRHSLAEAREQLPELVERALRGEPVVITRDGKPVAEIRPVAADRPGDGPVVTAEALAWLDRLRVWPAREQSVDAGKLVSRVRDEDWR